ncbi:MAG: cytochrome c3 family protein, partial [Desulfobacterales bacterium]
MSTEDKANEVSAVDRDRHSATPPTDPGAQDPADGAGGTITLFFIIGLVASLVVGWVIFPQLLYSKKEQPVDFNHALHNELVEDSCESCHFFREDGTFSGVPKLAQCIDCHEEVNGEDPEEEKFVTQYVAKGREVPWLVYARQPDCVFFSHIAHVKMGQMDCVTCHGHIGESESLKV